MKKEVPTVKKAVWYMSGLRIFGKVIFFLGKETLSFFYILFFESTKPKKISDSDSDVYLKKNQLFKLVVIDPGRKSSHTESES